MGYDICIGEARMVWPDADSMRKYSDTEPRIEVKGTKLDHAPGFPGDEMTGKGNSRHPGYGAWSGFTDRAGLRGRFFDEESGLMRKHPGCFALQKDDLDAVRAALDSHKTKWPNVVAGWCPCESCKWSGHGDNKGHREEFAQPQSGDRARLVWLEFWMAYALENFEHAAISNR